MSGYEKIIEEYIEIIGGLLSLEPVARVKDIAHIRGVTLPTVTSAVEKLKDLGLVEHKHYSYVTLTEKGKNLVFELNTIHYAIKELFVKVLGLEENIADQDACNLEHHISPQSLIALRKMVTFLNTCPKNISSWLKIFHNCRFFTEKSDSCQQCEIMQGENL